ncbi:MAG: hypothetical protein WC343_02625 [Bacilli bacterium]|jgi:hypothetical protein
MDVDPGDHHSIFPDCNDPFLITHTESLEKQLQELILNEVTIDSKPNVFILERKGKILFSPFFKDIRNNNQGIYTMKIFDNLEAFRVRAYGLPLDPSKSTILLTDAIRNGGEFNKFLETGVSKRLIKVCGYLADKVTLERLTQEYPDTEFVFLTLVPGEDYRSYWTESAKLNCLFHSRMSPSDGEHPYVIQHITPSINISTLKEIIIESVEAFYSGPFTCKDDDNAREDYTGFTITLKEPDSFLSNAEFPVKHLYETPVWKLRFKFNTNESKLRIMALALPDYHPNRLQKLSMWLSRPCKSQFSQPICANLQGKVSQQGLNTHVCPFCIDTNIALFAIQCLMDEVLKNPKNRGYSWNVIDYEYG